MDDLTKKITTSVAVIAVTLVSIYYVWQAIFGMPFLVTFIGIATAICIIFAEAISIWWYFDHVKNTTVRNSIKTQQLLDEARQRNQLPPGY